ncbi:unnamed protein product, partial [Ranitomeya imitator]
VLQGCGYLSEDLNEPSVVAYQSEELLDFVDVAGFGQTLITVHPMATPLQGAPDRASTIPKLNNARAEPFAATLCRPFRDTGFNLEQRRDFYFRLWQEQVLPPRIGIGSYSVQASSSVQGCSTPGSNDGRSKEGSFSVFLYSPLPLNLTIELDPFFSVSGTLRFPSFFQSSASTESIHSGYTNDELIVHAKSGHEVSAATLSLPLSPPNIKVCELTPATARPASPPNPEDPSTKCFIPQVQPDPIVRRQRVQDLMAQMQRFHTISCSSHLRTRHIPSPAKSQIAHSGIAILKCRSKHRLPRRFLLLSQPQGVSRPGPTKPLHSSGVNVECAAPFQSMQTVFNV